MRQTEAWEPVCVWSELRWEKDEDSIHQEGMSSWEQCLALSQRKHRVRFQALSPCWYQAPPLIPSDTCPPPQTWARMSGKHQSLGTLGYFHTRHLCVNWKQSETLTDPTLSGGRWAASPLQSHKLWSLLVPRQDRLCECVNACSH